MTALVVVGEGAREKACRIILHAIRNQYESFHWLCGHNFDLHVDFTFTSATTLPYIEYLQ